MMSFWGFVEMNYPEIAENETIDYFDLLALLEDVYNIGYNNCLEENEIDD